ncbi:hypothetical protein [Actinokineospora enzanensis]|uniref:hypothetical protein n=1 Tax=Actinokineospora enzanensis TaxID=155975 RepID=UPI001FE0F0BF|nr:hypothetical protein [Actinokineospora enzanensis]
MFWAGFGLAQRLGVMNVEPYPELLRNGKAEVQSCSGDWVTMWMTVSCDARVRWDGMEATEMKVVHSTHDLSGTVAVQEQRVQNRRYSTRKQVVSADYTIIRSETLSLVLVAFCPVSGFGLGFFLGGRLARLLPEPPPKVERLKLKPFAPKRGPKRPKRGRRR